MGKMPCFSLSQNEQAVVRMTRCALEHSRDKLPLYRRGKIYDLIAGEKRKDRPGSPKVR